MKQQANGRKLVLTGKAANAEALAPQIVDVERPEPPPGHAVVEVKAAAVNPSDVKAALGLMPHAIWPRTPGRDYAGTVVAGPAAWLGVDVWGTGGDLGVSRDGTHARYLVLPVDALSRKPQSVSIASFEKLLLSSGSPCAAQYRARKRAASTGMSTCRSRSEGSRIANALTR